MKHLKLWFRTFLITGSLLLAIAATMVCSAQIIDTKNYDRVIKVACVGNSITYGMGIEKRDSLSYPAQLARMLGEKWEVRNFGVSGRTLLTKGDRPYIIENAYNEAKAFLPNIVLIKLGTNDTKPHNWEHKGEFKKDYISLVNSFQQLDSKPLVILLKAVPAFPERWGISDSTIRLEVNPMVEELAKELNIPFIDLHTPLIDRGDLFPDQIHPNAEGAAIMAKCIFKRLIFKD